MPSCLRSLIEKRRGMGGIIDTVRTAERQVRRGHDSPAWSIALRKA